MRCLHPRRRKRVSVEIRIAPDPYPTIPSDQVDCGTFASTRRLNFPPAASSLPFMDRPCLTLRELKATADATPQTHAVRTQVAAITLKKTKSDKDYLELGLGDGSDTITLRLWLDHPLFPAAQRLLPRAWIELVGDWTQNQFGLDLRPGASLRTLTEAEAAELLDGPADRRRRQAEDFAHIGETVAGLRDPRLQAVCLRFLEVYGERFRRTAAAREYHHARRGGLVEHVAQMMRCAEALTTAYQHLNRDLLLAGVLFHDCGKLWENAYVRRRLCHAV